MTPEELAEIAHLRRARDLMDREYWRPLDVPAMARAACMSPSHFSRRFRALYGETPYSYLMTRRIERAKALLRAGLTVTEAACRRRHLARVVQLPLHRDRACPEYRAGPQRAASRPAWRWWSPARRTRAGTATQPTAAG